MEGAKDGTLHEKRNRNHHNICVQDPALKTNLIKEEIDKLYHQMQDMLDRRWISDCHAAWKVSKYRVSSEYRETLCISPYYSVWMQENMDQKKLLIWTLFMQCHSKWIWKSCKATMQMDAKVLLNHNTKLGMMLIRRRIYWKIWRKYSLDCSKKGTSICHRKCTLSERSVEILWAWESMEGSNTMGQV